MTGQAHGCSLLSILALHCTEREEAVKQMIHVLMGMYPLHHSPSTASTSVEPGRCIASSLTYRAGTQLL